MTDVTSEKALDSVLALQLTVAWAGEGLCEPPRLGWWQTDLIDELGGGDLLARLLPRTHRWAALEAVRQAAVQEDRKARRALARPDEVLELQSRRLAAQALPSGAEAPLLATREVSLTELMPLSTAAERRWAYYVPQSIPKDAVAHAPESVRELRILDPAVGSGHFLVVAFELLVALYREEARHRSEEREPRWSDSAIVERILEHNLHGVDLDLRAVRIAAAGLWLKAKQLSSEAQPRHLNLVASNLRLASLPDDDPALVELRLEVEAETGIPATLTDTLVHALQGADHLGSLLRIDQAVETAIREHEAMPQLGLFDAPVGQPGSAFEPEKARRTLLDRLEGFLARHGSGDDLGLRLRGEQLAAGVRFMRMMAEGRYDLVVGNPPYLSFGKLGDSAGLKRFYPERCQRAICCVLSPRARPRTTTRELRSHHALQLDVPADLRAISPFSA